MKQAHSFFLTGRSGPFKLCAVLLMVILAGCNSSSQVVKKLTPTPTALQQFSTINLGIPADALNSPVVGTLPDNTLMNVRLMFKVTQDQQNQLSKISKNGEDLGKRANQIGISDATFAQIKSMLGIQGVTLTLSKLHTLVKVDGQAKTMATIFQTHFELHKYKGRTFYAPAPTPKLPTFIVNDLVSVTGLDSFSQPLHTGFTTQTNKINVAHATSRAQADCSPPAGEDFPTGVAHAYGYEQFAHAGFFGDGMTINLIEIDGFSQSDVANYGQCVGYRGHITVKNIDSAPQQPGEESVLDVEMIEGLARDINIVDYQTGNSDVGTGIVDELQQLIDDNTKNTGSGNVVSISIGGPENYESVGYLKAVDQELSVLTQREHMTVFIASGDCGAFTDRVIGSFSVSFPASDPNAVAVGGTVLQIDQQGKRAGEIVWSDNSDTTKCTNSWGSGGGSSNFYQIPGYQSGKGVNNDASRGFRQVPDVSAVALNLPLYFNGQWLTFSDGTGAGGGTSAATPIWATGMALVNQVLIKRFNVFFSGPIVFYYVANHAGNLSPYFDVTQGNNLGFNATPGWDFATGFGTPNLVDFYNVLAGAASSH